MSHAQAPAARTLGHVVTELQEHNKACITENVPVDRDRVTSLLCEAVSIMADNQAATNDLLNETGVMARLSSLESRMDGFDAAKVVKPTATKATKRGN